MSKFSAADTLQLPLEERVQLVGDIWDTIAVSQQPVQITEDEKRLIDERLANCRRDPGAASPLEEVFARISARGK